ncbi:hypothetical protein [Streptomyces sp. NBC_01210]|uniref:hypothetical protein n=1 Tax=Streptomyces sp. NBC_01210 TaxID=2903774 RepID=UPI003FA3676B
MTGSRSAVGDMRPSARLVDVTEAGTGDVRAIVGALHDEFADELREGGEDVEDQAPPGVVVLSD